MSRAPQVCWLFSPIRSGSSITAYAAGAALGSPVADEIFGPWDRTGPPYHYPPAQRRLKEVFEASGQRLTREAEDLAAEVLTMIAGSAETVICKHPHASIGPEHILERWPAHRCVVMMRNPLWALNSLFVRGWEAAAGGGSMIRYFSIIGRRWLDDPHRLVYEHLKRDPEAFFARLFNAWGIGPTNELVRAAAEYRAEHYHHSSRDTHRAEDPQRVRSERAWRLPDEILTEYLADPLMRQIFEEAEWPLDRDAYGSHAAPA